MNPPRQPSPDDRPRGDLTAPFVLLFGPLLTFLSVQGRSPFHLDVLLLSLVVGLVAVFWSRVLRLARDTAFYVLPAAMLVLVWIDLQFVADGRFRMIGVAVLGGVWLLREHATTLASVSAGVLTVLTVATGPHDSVDRWKSEDAGERSATTQAAELPPIVHFILDEHSGIAGLPPGSDGDATGRAIANRYLEAGFRVYPRAFSRYSLTANSLPSALTFSAPNTFYALIGGRMAAFPAMVEQNAYFRRMHDAGYSVRVYQPSFLDLCDREAGIVVACTTAPPNSLVSFDHIGLGAAGRASLLGRYWLGTESYLWARARSVLGRLRSTFGVVALEPATTSVSVGGALDLIARLESDIVEAPTTRGVLYFAHVLLPHSPFLLDASCTPTARPLTAASARPGADAAYLAQTRCTTEKVMELIDRVEGALGAEAVIVVHGDHGARLLYDGNPPEGVDVTEALLTDRYSTLLAVRAPDIERGIDTTSVAIETALDALTASGFSAERLGPSAPYLYLDHWPTDEPLERIPLPANWLRRQDSP